VQKDKIQRRRPGVDNRLKDDRGPRRDRERNGGERFDRSENPPADSTNNNGSDKGNPDEPIFDNFGGQGLRVAPFAPDIPPPPVLMPVPGAGYVLSCFILCLLLCNLVYDVLRQMLVSKWRRKCLW